MKSILKFSGTLLAFFALYLTACNNSTSSGSEETSLRFKMKEGNSYEYVMSVDIDQEVMGQKNKVVVGTTFTMVPTGSQDSTQTVKATYDRFALNMDAAGMSMEIDTEKPVSATDGDLEQNPMLMVQRLFSAIKGKSFSFEVNENGELTSVSGVQELLNAIVDSAGLPEEMKAQMLASMEDQFSEQAIKDQFSTFFSAFANRKVKVGDTWDLTTETKGRMGGKFDNTYIVKAIEGKNVTLGVNTKVTGTQAESLSGTQTGTMVIDTDLGMIKTGEMNQDLKMSMQGMAIDMKGKVTITGRVK